MALFGIGEFYPHPSHAERIERYKENKKLFLGKHAEAFKHVQDRLTSKQKDLIYVSVNLPGIICKKSADFLFGEKAGYSAGKEDKSPEQVALDRLANDNELQIKNYQSALANAYRGDSFFKIRWGQEWEGMVDKKFDPFKAIIECQNPVYVFPETFPGNASKIFAYHIAFPEMMETKDGDYWYLNVESHYPGYITYSRYAMDISQVTRNNEIVQWRITGIVSEHEDETKTGVPFPLVIHIPNYATDDTWEGIDDIDEHKAVFDEINNRLSQIATILDKHADPAMAVPTGTLGEDADGNPTYAVGIDKVFEVMGKDDIVPAYITWNGQLQAAFEELKKLVELLLMTAEIPEVALGSSNSGTSGSSGLAIKFRLNSILAKINRKRQFYDKGLKQVLYLVQLLEQSRGGKDVKGYEPTKPIIKFKDGLPNDDAEQANIMSIRTGGKPTISQKSALMMMDDLTDEQAEAEIKRIDEELEKEESADVGIFNQRKGNKGRQKNDDNNWDNWDDGQGNEGSASTVDDVQ